MNQIYKYKANASPKAINCASTIHWQCYGVLSGSSLILLIFVVLFSGCKRNVQVDTPPDRITQENVFSSDRSATTALTDLCVVVSRIGVDMAEFGGLLADEWILWPGAPNEYRAYYINNLEANQTVNTGTEIWNVYYSYIFRCNAALEGIVNNKNLSPFVQKQLSGEAYFLRAWFYFYLLNLYGELPLAVSTDSEINRVLARSSEQSVYQLIENDLLQAQDLLSREYLNGQLIAYSASSIERVRPSFWAATALLARVYLYAGNWEKAISESNKLIEKAELFGLSPLSQTFLKNSREAIWQVQPSDLGWNTRDARRFHLLAPPAGLSSDKRVHISQFMMSAFEFGDKRRKMWVDSLIAGGAIYYFPVKYKIAIQNSSITSAAALTEYCMALRLSEQYLISAEAKVRLGNLPGAISDLDSIRSRAGLQLISNTNPSISKESLLEFILHERQVEFFSEWGHRWFDLKRFNKADDVMSSIAPSKGGSWESTDKLLPIPFNDLLRNPRLVQNLGY